MLNEDYSEILLALSRNKVRFLVVGAYAMGIYGYPRATGDFDIWIEPSLENSQKAYKSLQEFGAPLKDITEKTFNEEGIIFQIGVAPRRIDLITQIDGVTFKDAYTHKELVKIENLNIPFLSKSDLIKNKESTGREKDKLDVKYLRRKKL
jgi:hypothetical protein